MELGEPGTLVQEIHRQKIRTMGLANDILNVFLENHTFGQKFNYLKYKFSKKKEVLNYDPIIISIVGTTNCTLSCDMCPTHSAFVPRNYPHIQQNVKDIDFDMFREIIDRFGNALTVHIIGSGEPLLNRDFFRMVDYAAMKKMIVKTFSNGTTIAENISNILNSKLNGITISLNGQNAEEFRRMTGMAEAVYEDIYNAAKKLIEERNRTNSNVSVKLSHIIDSYNYKFIPDMVDVSLKLGADHIFFCNFLPSPYTGLTRDERMLMAEGKIIKDIGAIFRAYPPRIRNKLTPPLLLDAGLHENRCDTHFSQIRFDGDGNISSCSIMLLNMIGYGDYREGEVWNNDYFKKMRRIFLSGDESLLPEPCKSCPDNKGIFEVKGLYV